MNRAYKIGIIFVVTLAWVAMLWLVTLPANTSALLWLAQWPDLADFLYNLSPSS